MIKIISWNVNGLGRILNNSFLEFIKEEIPDYICIQETHATEEKVAELTKQVEGFHVESSSAVKNGSFYHSGVTLFSRKTSNALEKSFEDLLFDGKGRILIAEYPEFVLFNCYFPTGTSPEKQALKRAFYRGCYSALKKKIESGKEVILCGDFNTARDERDVANASQKKNVSGFLPEDREDIERLFSLGLIDAFRIHNEEDGHYTWWHNYPGLKERNQGWRIDYFLISPGLKDRVKMCYHRPEIVRNDHCPIVLELSDLTPSQIS